MESRQVSDEELKRVTEQAFLAALVRGAISHLRSGVVARSDKDKDQPSSVKPSKNSSSSVRPLRKAG